MSAKFWGCRMKSVLLSTRPKWCGKIYHKIGKDENGKPIYEKQIEVRKSKPSEVPFKAYIYMTATKERCKFWEYITAYQNGKGEILDGSQKIIGEFICDKVIEWKYLPDFIRLSERMYYISGDDGEKTCLSYKEIEEYGKGKTLYGWHISDLKIYDKPRELSEFRNMNGQPIKRAYQSWGYVEEDK